MNFINPKTMNADMFINSANEILNGCNASYSIISTHLNVTNTYRICFVPRATQNQIT